MDNQRSEPVALSPEVELEKHYKRNYIAHCLDGAFFIAGINFVSLNSILPVFVRSLTDSSVLVGLLTTVTTVGTSLPQLMAANVAARYERKRDLVVTRYAWGQRIPWLLMAVNAFFVVPRSPSIGLVCFFFLYASYAFASGLTIPVWFDVVVKSLPVNKRGRVLGTRYLISGTASVAAGYVAGRILGVLPSARGYSLLFFLAFAFTMASLPAFAAIWEPRQKVLTEKRPMMAYLRELPSLLARDSNYVMYLVANSLVGLGGMAGAFYTVYALDKLGLPASVAGTFAAIILASQTLSNLVWGQIADRKGYKLVMEIALFISCLAAVMAFFADSKLGFGIVLVLFGLATGGSTFAGMNVITEMCTPEDRPTYISLASTVGAPIAGVAPLLGGILADAFGYQAVFLAALCSIAMGLVVLSRKVKTNL